MGDYTPAANALAATEQARALDAEERKQTAYNAFAATYGKALAGDPETALKIQDYQQNEKLNPIAVEQAGANLTGKNISNTGAQQEVDYNALANPKKLAGLDIGNENVVANTANTVANTNKTNTLLPGEVTQQAAQTANLRANTALTGTQNQVAQVGLKSTLGDKEAQGAMSILAALSTTASEGGDVGAAFDKYAPLIAKYEGVDESHMQGLRAAVVNDPIGTINNLSDAIHAGQMAKMGASGKGAAGALAMVKFGQQQMNLKDGLQFVQSRVAAVPEATAQATQLAQQMSPIATIRKVKQEIPGTPEYQFKQVVEQIKSNLSLDDIRSLRAAGVSLGKPNMAEFAGSANAVANLDLGQSQATILANLKRIDGTYKDLNKTLTNNIGRLGTGTNGHIAKAAPATQFQAGTVYVDANGNRATTPDGGKTWVAQ